MKYIVLVDGGYLKKVAFDGVIEDSEKAKRIANCINGCARVFEEKILPSKEGRTVDLLRILYYDCPPYQWRSGNSFPRESWLRELAKYPKMALRLGDLKFRGFRIKEKKLPQNPRNKSKNEPFNLRLRASDFEPVFEQKGVDMRIGIDIATYSLERMVDHILLVSGDADCVPAMKLSRKSGVSVGIVQFKRGGYQGKKYHLAHDLICHADDVVKVDIDDIGRTGSP